MPTIHIPVLLHEVVKALARQEDGGRRTEDGGGIYLDGTLGGAGHALAMAKAFNGKLSIVGLDQDPASIERAKETLQGKAEKVILEIGNFRDLDKILDKHGIDKVDAITLDLGLSSDELESSGRGFSFLKSEPLHMTFGDPSTHPFTARDIINNWKEEDIANVIFAYGEEKYAKRIAKALVVYREKTPIEKSDDLAEVIKTSVPVLYRRGKIHPATRTFQALRIAVNDELNALKEGLSKGHARLAPGGRIAVISFHSLEDRIVKEFFKKQALYGDKILTKKPLTASPEELAVNPRSRSAKLRILEKAIN